MGKPTKKRADRRTKRTFQGNQFKSLETNENSKKNPQNNVTSSNINIMNMANTSSSFAKLGSRETPAHEVSESEDFGPEGNRIVDIGLFCDFITSFPCQLCGGKGCLNVSEEIVGLASKIYVTCDNDCDFERMFETSKKTKKARRFGYTVNQQFTLAMCAIGRHRMQAERFTTNMDMPCPVSTGVWNVHLNEVTRTTKNVAEVSMRRAANQVRKEGETISNVTASCDGTWQRRGFSSKNGVSTVLTVDSGCASKVVDTEVMSNYCNKCSIKKANKVSDEDMETWFKSHKTLCMKNHTGAAGAMEPVGIKRIFRRSIKTRKLRYTGFLGDGDSKSYNTVVSANPPIYRHQINKLECCGHVQKRMGKRLMDKVLQCKNKSYTENGKTYKGLGGQNRLTQKSIQRIQGHYGAAIRNNRGDVPGMKKAIMTIWKHRAKDHSECEDWCPSKTGKGQKDQHALPKFVCDEIKPVFEALSSNDLLKKCAHGGTQNTNESFHHLIWERCPKTTFVGRRRLELAVADATIAYNDGELGRLNIFHVLGLSVGKHLRNGLRSIDVKRLQSAYVPGIKSVIKARRARALVSKNQENDPNYGAGQF